MGNIKEKITGTGKQSFLFNQSTGNLIRRSFRLTTGQDSVYEAFTYDNMNRLYTSRVGTGDAFTINYSDNGNITSRTDVGSYSYNSIQKNAVVGLTDYPDTLINQQEVAYTTSNMTSSVTATEAGYEVNFTYGPDDQRIKSVLKLEGTPQKTKYYSGGYEKEVTGSGTRHLHYIYCPYGLVAVLVKEGETTTTWYTETDHLGSIIGLMNSSGAYAEQFSYDPWGRRRNPADWTFNNVPNPSLLDRGYTGHEHLDKLGLINMNGRMYDPILGRFLGVDPVIQVPDNSQNFNGYSYCLNNPLKYTDPSGYSYFQNMKDLYEGSGHFYYRGGEYWMGEDGWEYYQPSLGGGMAPAANISYDALHPEGYHYNYSTHKYHDNSGGAVSFYEVYNNYVVPNSSLTIEFHHPQSPNENSQQNNQNDLCGNDSWELFYNIHDAESYLQENENCRKEKFMYITDDQWVLVGPWNDATIKHVSPQWVDRYSKGSIYEDGCIYKADFFVHTHFNSPNPSPVDIENGKYYYYPYGVRTLIYYERQYYEFDLKIRGKKYFFGY